VLINVTNMVTASVLTEITGELASIEQLISDLLQKQTDLGTRLTSIEEPWLPCPGASTAGVVPNPIPGPSSWSMVVAGGKSGRSSPPVPVRRGGDDPELELSNSFAPLADLPALSVWVPWHPDDLSPVLCPLPTSFPGHPTSVSVKRNGSRKATSKQNRSPSDDSLSPRYISDKRPRVSSPSSEAPLGAMAAPDGTLST
jgi:hypothetical protein